MPQLVIITFFVVWYWFPPIVFGPQSIFTLASVWRTLYVTIVLLAVVELVLRWAAYVRPMPPRFRALTSIVVRGQSGDCSRAAPKGIWSPVGEREDRTAPPARAHINSSVYAAVIMAGAFSIGAIVLELRGLTRHGGERPPQGVALGC
jgi:hypothetical protein